MENIKLFFGGDIAVAEKIKKQPISKEILFFLKNHDKVFFNWEAPIINNKSKPIIKAGPSIYQHNGFDQFFNTGLNFVFSTANNHIFDYGKEGLENTLKTLDFYKIPHFGSGLNYNDAYSPFIFEKGNIKVAVLGVAENQFGAIKPFLGNDSGYAWFKHPEVLNKIKEIKEKANFLVIYIHAGLEMCDYPLPEWRMEYKKFIAYGADLVIGSHPHVIQGNEEYKGKKIYYSLGNFFFNSSNKDKRWHQSMGLSCTFNLNGSIEITEEFFKANNDIVEILNTDHGLAKLQKLNEVLSDENRYISIINNHCQNIWHDYYKSYFTSYTKVSRNKKYHKSHILIQHLADYFLNTFFNKNSEMNEILMYHNISIESHRFVVERALKIINNLS